MKLMGLWIIFVTSLLSYNVPLWTLKQERKGQPFSLDLYLLAFLPPSRLTTVPPFQGSTTGILSCRSAPCLAPCSAALLISLLWLDTQYPLQKVCHRALKLFASSQKNLLVLVLNWMPRWFRCSDKQCSWIQQQSHWATVLSHISELMHKADSIVNLFMVGRKQGTNATQ